MATIDMTPEQLHAELQRADAQVLRAIVRVNELEAEAGALRNDAERHRKLSAKATKKTGHDVYGNGCLWTVGVFCDDSRLSFDAAVDALPAVGAA